MTGFTTIETRREVNIRYLAWQTGLTVEEIRELYKNRGGYYYEQEKDKAAETTEADNGS